MVIRIRLAEKIEKYEGGQNQSLGRIRQKMQASQSPLQVTSEKFVTPNEFNQEHFQKTDASSKSQDVCQELIDTNGHTKASYF